MIAIVGGGIAGAAALHVLARAGFEVELYDDGDAVSGGASGVPVALLNPYRGKRALPSAEDLAGHERFLAEVAELGAERAGWHAVGVLRLADSAERASAWRELPLVRWIASEELSAVAALELRASHGGFLFERGGFVDTRVLREALIAAARARGAAVRSGVRVHSLEPENDGVRLHTTMGERRARIAVSCTGAVSAPWAPRDDLRAVAGEVLCYARAPLGPAHIAAVREPVLVARCLMIRTPQEIHVGGAHGGDRAEAQDAAALLHAAGSALWPALAPLSPTSSFRATRAATPSNQPRVRRVAERLWSVEGLAGRGYLRAFELAAQLHRELGVPPRA